MQTWEQIVYWFYAVLGFIFVLCILETVGVSRLINRFIPKSTFYKRSPTYEKIMKKLEKKEGELTTKVGHPAPFHDYY